MKLKKLIVFLLSVFVISSTLLPSVAVKAADVQVDVRFRATGWDRGDAINLWNDGHRIYGLGNQFMLMYSTDGTMLYCIEPEVGLHDGDVMDLSNYVDAITTPTIQEPEIVPVLIGRVFQYVDYSVAGNPLNTEGGMALYTATQLLIWETVEGERDEYFNHVTPPSQYGQVLDCLTTAPMDDSIKQLIMDDYNYLVSKVQEHMVIPSFTAPSLTNAQTYQLKSNGGTLSVSLTDNNNVLGNFNFSSNNPNVQFSTAGNTLTVSANSGISGDVNVTLSSIDSRRSGLLCYGDGQEGLQDTVVVSTPIDDPVTSFFKLDVAVGSLEIVKSTQNNNGIVSGFTFEVRNSANTLVGTYTTDSTGKISVPNLQAGTYTVKEVNLSSDFVTPATNPQSITVVAGQSVSVSFNNIKKLGVINVKKNDANPALGGYSLAGAAIEVRDQGGTLVDTIITKADGNGQSKSLPLGVYRLKEVTAPSGFTLDPTTYNSALSGTLGTGSVVYSTDVTITEQPEVGRVNIVKSNANKAMGDYPLNGAVFEIRAAEDMVRIDGSYYAHKGDLMDTVTTNAAGQVQSKDLRLGNYTVTEKSSPFGYIRNQNSFTVKLEYGGQTVPVVYGTASVPETPQSGKIRIHKQDANPNMGDYQLSGAVFEIRAAADIKTTDGTIIYNKGDLVDTATTDATGLAVSKDLPLGEFTISEKSAPFGFVLNVNNYSTKLSYSGQDVTGVFSDVSIPEQPQTGTITVTKYDIATGTRAQGNATLNGAVFEVYAASDIKKLDGTIIYSKDQLVETLNCGNISSATTKELPLGAFYVKEKVPPVGYNLDTSRHDVNIEYQGQNVAVVRKNADVKNNVVEGWISVTKHTDLPDPDVTPQNPQIEEPLDNINFQVYLKSAGSYDAALPTERDIMTTNENGYAITKSLPYGLYVVKELPDTKGRDIKIVDPFEVFISAEGMTYRYILNDPTFKSLVKVTKVDSETGKTIPVAGVSFKVKDLSNSQWVTQHINYPTPVDIDVFQTSPDGSLVMPKVLKAGKYELYEQSAPWGYILNSKPVPFTINSDQADPAIAEVIMANAPAMGVISVDKKGDNLTGVTVADTSFGKQYTPVFGQVVLKGAIFEVRAAEDIYTPDGTLRYSKNTLVDTITTDSNGFAKTKQLYLGNYILTEVKAPENFVLDKTPHNVSLVYAGQSVPVVSAQSSIGNARQQVDIELQKLMEKPIDAVKDFNPFQDVIFGLFSDEDIKADNGSVAIPKGSLVALMRIDDNGKGVIKGELPFVHYYIKEVQTNNFYQLNSTKYPVSAVYQGQDKAKATIQVNNNGIAIPNEAKQGQITITKTGEMLVGATVFSNKDHSIYTPVYEIRNLPGATFNIIATEDVYNVYGTLIIPKGTIVDTVTTDSSGKAVSKLLHIGQYEIIETKAPDGTVLDKTPHPVTLGFDGEVSDIISKSVSIYNDRQKAEINLTKECESPSISDGSEMLPKDYNPYDGVTFALYASKDIKTADGTTAIPANSLLELVTFDENGKAVVKTDLPYGSFYLKEVKAADGYVLDSTKYNFNFDYDALGGKTVTINVNNGDPVNNNLQRGGLKLIKTFEGKTYPIANIPFHVVGHTYIGTTVEKDVVTDKNGEVNLEGLLAGNWTVTELGSDLSAGYVLSPTQAFTIANGKITELALENKLMRGDLTITKTFEGIRTPLKDIPFHIVGKTTAGIDYDETLKTDENGQIVLKGLLIGEYKIQELSCDLSTHFVLSEEQTAVVAQDKLTEMKIENNLIRGNVKLIKIACGTGDRLAGAEFQLFDQSGTSLGIYTTDENGEININNLVYGLGYKFVETKAPDGYKGKAVFTFDITENEKTIILSATNVPECTCPPSQDTCIPPKTGDEGIPIWVYTGLILSSGTLFGLMLFKRRKHA